MGTLIEKFLVNGTQALIWSAYATLIIDELCEVKSDSGMARYCAGIHWYRLCPCTGVDQ